MSDTNHGVIEDGEYLEIPPIRKLSKILIRKFEDQEKRNEFLEEENKKLKDEAYKDLEIQKLSAKLKEAQDECRRGFTISKEEEEAIRKWKKQHDKEVHHIETLDDALAFEGCCGGRFTYRFVPTSIGTFGTVYCNCGASFDFAKDF